MTPRWTVLRDEGGLLAIAKPAGVESTGRTPDDPGGLQAHVTAHLRRPVWLVHQLDRDTSGVLLFVRRRRLVAPWQARLRDATKRYLALTHGAFALAAQTIEAPLAYDAGARRWVTRADGKPARTAIRRLGATNARSLLEVTLHTGRTHQVRVHLAHLGHPLVGERRYREPPCDDAPRQMLHAWRLTVDGLTLEAPVPDDLRDAVKRSGLSGALPP